MPSPDPAFGDVQVPIASSFLMSSKAGKEVWIEPIVDKASKSISYRIRKGGTKEEIAKAKEGTKVGRGANFRCLLSDTAITPEHVKASGRAGRMSQSLIVIVAEGKGRRVYVEPSVEHEEIASSARPEWKPEQQQPDNPRWFSPPDYGMTTFGDLFTDRQLVALNTFSDLVHEARAEIERDALAAGASDDPTPLRDGGAGAKAYAEAVSVYLAFAIDRLADAGSSIATWASGGFIRFTFARQAIPMTWDFAECNFFSESTGNIGGALDWISKAIETFRPGNSGESQQHDAQQVTLPPGAVISTDPPYYDNIGYADLSDYFYVWLRPNTKRRVSFVD